jgi:hypothetical protein
MLSVNKYEQDYIDRCHSDTAARIRAYRQLASEARYT